LDYLPGTYFFGWQLAVGKEKTKKRRREENYKIQNTNYKQITIPKLQIPKKEVPFGQVLNACGGGNEGNEGQSKIQSNCTNKKRTGEMNYR